MATAPYCPSGLPWVPPIPALAATPGCHQVPIQPPPTAAPRPPSGSPASPSVTPSTAAIGRRLPKNPPPPFPPRPPLWGLPSPPPPHPPLPSLPSPGRCHPSPFSLPRSVPTQSHRSRGGMKAGLRPTAAAAPPGPPVAPRGSQLPPFVPHLPPDPLVDAPETLVCPQGPLTLVAPPLRFRLAPGAVRHSEHRLSFAYGEAGPPARVAASHWVLLSRRRGWGRALRRALRADWLRRCGCGKKGGEEGGRGDPWGGSEAYCGQLGATGIVGGNWWELGAAEGCWKRVGGNWDVLGGTGAYWRQLGHTGSVGGELGATVVNWGH